LTNTHIKELEQALSLETIYDRNPSPVISQSMLDLINGTEFCTVIDPKLKQDRAKTLLRRAAKEAASL
jgi:hypothetical protein